MKFLRRLLAAAAWLLAELDYQLGWLTWGRLWSVKLYFRLWRLINQWRP